MLSGSKKLIRCKSCWSCRHYPDDKSEAGRCKLGIFWRKWCPPFENKCAAFEYEPGTDDGEQKSNQQNS